jgi:hypothetical protein
VLLRLLQNLNTELPLGESAVLNSLVKILAMKVGILASKFESLVPDERVNTKFWGPMELDKTSLALVVDECEGVDTETLHHAVGSRDRSVRHSPCVHVSSLGVLKHEIPEVVVRRLSLGNFVVRFRLSCVDNIRKLHRVLNEENRDIIAHDVEIALLRIELDGETANITNGISRSTAAQDSRESNKDGCLSRCICE